MFAPRWYLTGLMILASSIAGAQNPPDVEAAQTLLKLQKTSLPWNDGKKIADSMTDLGLEMRQALAQPNENSTLSPFSITSAFGLVVNGAKGNTLTQVGSGLRLAGIDAAEFNRGYAGLVKSLRTISKDNVLSFGNAVFADTDFPVRSTYEVAVKKYLGATADNVNFQKTQEAADHINGYIAAETHGMIKQMVKASDVKGWRFALVNAGYYKGAWAVKFDSARTTEDADFNTGRGTKKVPLMRQSSKYFLYYQGNGFQMASLAYKNGDFAMDVIVPEKSADVASSLNKVATQFTGANYRKWIAAARPTKIHLALPRFEVEYKADLSDYFKKTMPVAFSDVANFLPLTTEAVKLDKVIHATVLKVNEEGTEGSFATVIGGTRAVSMPRPIPAVTADRPFFMVIRHTASGTPLFVSTVWDPKPLPKP